MTSVIWSKSARQDIERIWRFIAAHNPQAATDLIEAIDARIALVRDFPNIGPPTGRADRKLTIGRFPYVVNYVPTDGAILILGIRHMAQGRA